MKGFFIENIDDFADSYVSLLPFTLFIIILSISVS